MPTPTRPMGRCRLAMRQSELRSCQSPSTIAFKSGNRALSVWRAPLSWSSIFTVHGRPDPSSAGPGAAPGGNTRSSSSMRIQPFSWLERSFWIAINTLRRLQLPG
nr:hypothetical protein [Candidatus Sigynarchaeota archaeon]